MLNNISDSSQEFRNHILPEEDYMSMSLKPLGSRVVIEPTEEEDKTAVGIYLPENAKEKPSFIGLHMKIFFSGWATS